MAELSSKAEDLAKVQGDIEKVNVSITDVYERGKVDINFFASCLIPDVMLSPFPPFYVSLFHILTQRSPELLGQILRFALGLPRAHAKTTFIKVIIVWLIVYDKISFLVILCANQDLADNLLGDVHDMLCSDVATKVYGEWESQLTTDKKEEKEGLYHDRNVILMARGADSAIRGVNKKHKRPDMIFCDDAQTKENDESPTDSIKFVKRMVAMFKIIAPRGDRLIVYVGNMYSDGCFLYKLKESSSWISLITGAIREDGTPLWPELHSLESLMESYEHDESLGQADVWFAEVMNDPVSKATSLLEGPIPACPKAPDYADGVFLTIDPAGFRDISDDNVITLHKVIDGKGRVSKIDAGIKDPEQLIIRALQISVAEGASLIGVEETGYQQTLLFWFSKYIRDWGIDGIEIVPLKPKNRTKESRIRLFIRDLLSMNYYLEDAVRATFVWQAMKYKIGQKKNKDDILDACAYAIDVRNEYWHLIKNNLTIGRATEQIEIPIDNTPF